MGEISRLPLRALIVHPGDDHEASAAWRSSFQAELENLGVHVTTVAGAAPGAAAINRTPELHAVLVDVGLGDDGLGAVIAAARRAGADLPVVLVSDQGSLAAIPTGLVCQADAFLVPYADSVQWQAGRVKNRADRYRASLLPPMFGALVDYAQTHEHSWHTPGHEGGAAFFKSPVGRLFWEFFGEQTFRSDLSVSVGELGSLLDHSGPIGEAEREAARIFGADQTFFVTNGTSMANRVAYQSSVLRDDVVLCDRNCHKSVDQGVSLTGAFTVFLMPTRNRYGMIGPIPPDRMTPEAVAQGIRANPLVADDAVPVLATLTNSTYDGVLYDVPTVTDLLGALVARLHFDEAWLGYGAFNPLYGGRHALCDSVPDDGPSILATHSTHKLLAALSQASYLHVRHGRESIDLETFNEAYLMHATTSPLYPLLASNDVAAKMMDGVAGLRLTQESIDEAIAFRQTLARIDRDLADDWFFTCWQPGSVPDADGRTVAFDQADPTHLGTSREAWWLRPGATWHGFDQLPDGFAMLDPIKVTVLTPGVEDDGRLAEWGIPAALVAAYLDEKASIQVEKTQDYSLLFLFSMGVTRGKWGSLVTALVDFKHDFDTNQQIRRCLPDLFAQDPERYRDVGLADLASQMHDHMRETGQLALLARAFSELPEPRMRSADAYAHIVRGTVSAVPLDDLADRVVAVGVVPTPPGVPLFMPGEMTGPDDGAAIGYLKALMSFDDRFPGFSHEIHGVQTRAGEQTVLCVEPD